MPDTSSRHHVNPYIAGSAVKGEEMFFGREDVFAFVRRNLIGKHSNHPLVLYGQRRTGKTSVLHQLHRRLGPGYWCVLVDLHGLNLAGLGNLMQGIATVISRELRRDHQVTVEVPERSAFLTDPAAAFETAFLDQVWGALGDNQLVLMLDEAVRLDEEMRAGRLDHEVLEYLRHLMQHHERLNFIFSLGSGIEEMSRDYALLFSVSLYHRISFLEPSAARDLIIQPASGHYELTGQAVDRILQITSGHPYFTQLVCHCVFDWWARSPAAYVGPGDVDGVLAEAIELGSANLTYVWLDSSPAEQMVMAAIAASAGGVGTAVSEDEIRETWLSAGVDIPRHTVTQALRALLIRQVLAGNSRYSFTVELQRLWLVRHRRIDWVKEDLAEATAQWTLIAAPEPQHSALEPIESPAPVRATTAKAAKGTLAGAARHVRRLPKARFAALAAACAVVVALAALLGVREFRHGNSPKPPQMSTQEKDLAKRVNDSGSFTECYPAAQQVAGADASIKCEPLSSYISVSASSFNYGSPEINAFLKTIIPASMPVSPGPNSPACGYGSDENCLHSGFSGYKDSLAGGLIYGRLYCFERSNTYFIVWTYENDEYNSEYNEDFVVVASVASAAPVSSPLTYLIRWWDSGPV